MSRVTTIDIPQARNVSVLAIAQALFISVQSMSAATTPIAAHMLLGESEKAFATVPIFLVHFGIMATTIPASLLMGFIGRRNGFSVGAMVGVTSGLVGCAALYQKSFWLLCLSAMLQGAQAAFCWYFRLAAADTADPQRRANAISLVLAGGVLAGILGPQTAKWTADWLAPATFAGVYLAMAAFSLVMLGLVQALSIPNPNPQLSTTRGRPLRVIVRQPAYRVALVSSVFGYAVMMLTMAATPLAMLACGYGFSESSTVIQAHFIGMFLPSFFTGYLITRLGVLPIIAAGGLAASACALINLSGTAFANFFIANVLVGVGWNFAYIGGSTLLTTTYTVAERAKVQASHDFTVYAATATAAAVSGVLHANLGWTVLNFTALPLMGAVTTAAIWLLLRQRRTAPGSA